MYFIENQEGLIGKEVAYVWVNQFCEQTTIITKDKGVFMVCQEVGWDDGDIETRVFYAHEAKEVLYALRRELHKEGIIDESEWEEYEKELKKKHEAEKERFRKEQEEIERKQYKELRAKFENKAEPIKDQGELIISKWEVDLFIEKLTDDFFYPTIVSSHTKLDLDIVFERLMELTLDCKLALKFEWRTEEGTKILDLDRFNNLFKLKWHDQVPLHELYPVFQVSEEYKRHLNKRRSKK